MTEAYDWLADLIPFGQNAAISMDQLSRKIDADPRELRQMIENARRAGILICGDNHGYYFPASDAELSAYIQHVRNRIRTECVCLAPFLRRIKAAERG